MNYKLLFSIVFFALLVSLSSKAQVPERKGWWNFDDSSDLLKAKIGNKLELTGTQQSVAGPEETNLATKIDLQSYLSIDHGIAANGGGTMVNEWSLQIDFSVPQVGIWHAFFQTEPENNNDADLFTKNSEQATIGTAATTYSSNFISANTWYRMLVTVKNGSFFKVYINGELWVDAPNLSEIAVDGRFALKNKLLIFGDNDGDDGSIICSELGLWDVALTAQQVALLGNAKNVPTEIEVPNTTRKGWWKFNDQTNLTKPEEGYSGNITLIGSHSATTGPSADDGAVSVGVGSYYKLQHLISPNGGGNLVNEYTIQYDFKIPAKGIWYSFFQISPENNNDGELFINPSGQIGVGDVGYCEYSIIPNEWYRLLVSVKNGHHFTLYLDGKILLNGSVQSVDGRFALGEQLLIFADNDGEDGLIECSEFAIWDRALSSAEVQDIGGYNHSTSMIPAARVPYLQSPGQNTINICWHDTAQAGTKVEYGTSPTALNQEAVGTSEVVSQPFRWHSVKLSGLQADTRYWYKVSSGNENSKTYSFKTLPDANYQGKIRFLILGDTHASDTTMAGKVLRAAKAKIIELYGDDIESSMNGILHSGDIVVNGNSIEQYSKQYFQPLSVLSPNLPTTVVAGNHEMESPLFYKYLKIDDLSAFPQNSSLNEKAWQLRVGNSLFIGLNTNVCGEAQANWLDSQLEKTENDSSIDFVFLFFHHPPISELWNLVNSDAGGSGYVRITLLPIIKKYTKVQQLHYGHTHGFERGAIQSPTPGGDFRIICGGGGGGPLDPWAPGENRDFNDISVCYSHYFFQILEIDIANESYKNTMYSLGSAVDPQNNTPLDSWYKIKNQANPDTPLIENVTSTNENVQISVSKYSGIDSLMSVQFQVIDSTKSSSLALDSLIQVKNIYGVDENSKPIDKNSNVNPYLIVIKPFASSANNKIYYRVRYRDNNLKWSNWSNLYTNSATGINDKLNETGDSFIYQSYPNPFSNNLVVSYTINSTSEVSFCIYDVNGKLVTKVTEGMKHEGNHTLSINTEDLGRGVYLCVMHTQGGHFVKKIIKD